MRPPPDCLAYYPFQFDQAWVEAHLDAFSALTIKGADPPGFDETEFDSPNPESIEDSDSDSALGSN